MHNIEKRNLPSTTSSAPYRGWDASGRLFHIRKIKCGVNRWQAHTLGFEHSIYARTLAEISQQLEALK